MEDLTVVGHGIQKTKKKYVAWKGKMLSSVLPTRYLEF